LIVVGRSIHRARLSDVFANNPRHECGWQAVSAADPQARALCGCLGLCGKSCRKPLARCAPLPHCRRSVLPPLSYHGRRATALIRQASAEQDCTPSQAVSFLSVPRWATAFATRGYRLWNSGRRHTVRQLLDTRIALLTENGGASRPGIPDQNSTKYGFDQQSAAWGTATIAEHG
jgi:hypothetical protein